MTREIMGVLFVMPDWVSASELWMQRMIEELEPHIVGIASQHQTETLWRGRIPAIDLKDYPPPLWRRVCRKLRLPVCSVPHKMEVDVLRDAVNDSAVTEILVHYLEFALRYGSLWANTSKKLFIHCHGYDVTWDLRAHETPDVPSHEPDYVRRVLELSASAIFIANSNVTANKLRAIGVAENRIAVKYLGVPVVDTSLVRPCERAGGLNILFLGRLVDFKGPDLVIQAFNIACERGFDGTLTLAGDGPMRVTCELLRCESRFADRITMVGAVDAETGKKLRNLAHVFTAHNQPGILSRQEEAYGVSIVEAMASALPVVTGRSGGVEETVVHGETGFLVAPGDVEAHAEAFLQLASSPELCRKMGLAGWQRAKAKFSCEHERMELLKIMEIQS
jgi:colanic acid/amylovoran biosynthesis glycosyltransferase